MRLLRAIVMVGLAALAVAPAACGLPDAGRAGLPSDATDTDACSPGDDTDDCTDPLLGCTADKPVLYRYSAGVDDEQSVCVADPTFAPCTSDAQCSADAHERCIGITSDLTIDSEPDLATGICSRFKSAVTGCVDADNQPVGCASVTDQDPPPSSYDPFAPICGVNAIAIGDACLPRCGVGTTSCPDGFACTPSRPTIGIYACEPFCVRDTQCTNEQVCNPYSHLCTAPVDLTKQANGASCASGLDCRSSVCDGYRAGYSGGLCVSTCVQPPDAAYAGPTLPVGGCPENDVCAPNPEGGAGIVTQCMARCTTTADCREDYLCVHPTMPAEAATSTDGFCDARADPLAEGQ